MRTKLLTATFVLIACTARPVASDDEAGVTTAMGESESSDSSSSDSSSSESESANDPGSTDDSHTIFIGDGDIPPDAPCDLFMQDCPRGEKCVGYDAFGGETWNAEKCVPVLGDQHEGEPCTWDGFSAATDDCDANTGCWNLEQVEGQWTGTCHAFCSGSVDNPLCPEGFSCPISGDPHVAFCVPDCDPLAQDCDEGLGCYWTNFEFSCVFTDQGIPTGEPCGFVNDCAPGNLCAAAETLPSCAGDACCTSFCDLELGDAGCVGQPGSACVAFFEEGMAPNGQTNIGICVLP
ncbi:hypothetical protein ACNOYE_05230 [Nannocystaceae bacterium ST9]